MTTSQFCFAGNAEHLQIINLQGIALVQQKVAAASFQTRIDLPALPAGIYQLVFTNGQSTTGNRLVIQ